MTSPSIRITDDLKRIFQAETAVHLDQLESLLLRLEHAPDPAEPLQHAFRTVHGIKGNADYLGMTPIQDLAHHLEDLLDDLRSGRTTPGPETIDPLLAGLDQLKILNQQVAPDPAKFPETTSSHPTDNDDPLADAVQVPNTRIDRLMEHLAELARTQARLQRMVRTNRNGNGGQGDLQGVSADLKSVFTHFQTDLMALRLVRLDTLFNRLRRAVRDTARKQGKAVILKSTGGEAEIDRTIMSHLIDPLTHLVRNAVDHGIETPEARVRAGKPETGTVTLSAWVEGVGGVIEVGDDGGGLQTDKIRQAARDGGFIPPAELDTMAGSEVDQLVLRAGLTTRRRADTVSGRGVGLDAVAGAISALGGRLQLDSNPGQGTRVRLRVPISMTLTEVLLIEARGNTLAVPFAAIRKVRKARPDEVRGPAGAEIIRCEGQWIALHRIDAWLNKTAGDHAFRGAAGAGEILVLVISAGGRETGVEVDAVLRPENVVIRPLQRFTQSRIFSGAAILGDGRVVLVIDPLSLTSPETAPTQSKPGRPKQ